MNKNTKFQIYCLFTAALFIGIFGAVCLYLGISNEYNNAMGYFNVASVFAPVVYCCLAAGPVLGIAGWIVFRKHVSPDEALPGGIVSSAASVICALTVTYSTVSEIISYKGAAPGSLQNVTVISWVIAGIAVASFIVNAFLAKKGPVKPFVSLLSFAPVLYCASKVLLMYFNQDIAVNSPIKFICQLSYLSFMLVLCAETGMSLGKGNIFPRYIFTLCAATAIGGTCAIAAAAATLTKADCVAIVGPEWVEKIGLFIYVCVRAVLAARINISLAMPAEKKAKAGKKEENAPLDEESAAIFDEIVAEKAKEEEKIKEETEE